MIVQVGDYDVEGSPLSWTKVVALRHAMVKFPDCRYMWYLDQDSFIMDPTVTLEQHIMNPDRLEKAMLRDLPVVPPDSIIKTFAHLKGRDVDFVLSQDKEGLSIGSFVVRNGDWAQFLLETWYDPLYRGYNFQKAEGHALVSSYLQQTPAYNCDLTVLLGAYCPVASYNPVEDGHCAPGSDEPLHLTGEGRAGLSAW